MMPRLSECRDDPDESGRQRHGCRGHGRGLQNRVFDSIEADAEAKLLQHLEEPEPEERRLQAAHGHPACRGPGASGEASQDRWSRRTGPILLQYI